MVVFLRVWFIKFWEIVETNPAFTFFHIVQLFNNFIFRMSRLLYNNPKFKKVIVLNLAVMVLIHLIEKLSCWNLCKFRIPVVNSLLKINRFTVVLVEHVKHLLNLLLRRCWKFLNLTYQILTITYSFCWSTATQSHFYL